MRNTGRRVESYPVNELSGFPKRYMLPNSMKVAAQCRLSFGMLREGNRLCDVGRMAKIEGAQRSEQNTK